ncbi:MAG TPA: sodium/proton-translocating pyrophosphatase, partial [Blastocatellia bacterium]|nr:sodium/proton-translocating pyrophosphatase [Blastocatellia bacterium]
MMAGNLVQILIKSVKTGSARLTRLRRFFVLAVVAVIGNAATAFGQAREAAATHQPGGEANLKLPDLSQVKFMGVDGHTLLLFGLVICVLGLLFGLAIYTHLKNLPVHKAMREISELIYATCQTYLRTQAKFIFQLWVLIAAVIVVYFAALEHVPTLKVVAIAGFSVVGILGSTLVAAFGIRVNTFANSRAAFASLRGKPYPVMAIPLEAGMSIGTVLISVELLLMLAIMLFLPGEYAGPCFIGFAVGESLGAAALRIAG